MRLSIPPGIEMKREPTEEENRKIVEAIVAGDRVEATNIYITITECGLTEAQEFIRTLTTEVRSTEEEKHSTKQQSNFWQRLISSLKK
jgi:hypothetical protein